MNCPMCTKCGSLQVFMQVIRDDDKKFKKKISCLNCTHEEVRDFTVKEKQQFE